MSVTVRQIELFVALMRNPHIGNVADEHFLTQSAVSMAIKQLEETVGAQLFDRISNRLVPNENGRMFFERMEPVLEQFHEAETLFNRDRMAGVLTVGASSTIADYILPQVLFSFRDNFPEVRIEMLSRNSAEVIAGVESGHLALGFIEGDYESPVVNFKELCTEELTIVTSDKKFAGAKEYTMEELLDKRWILRERGSGTRQTMWEHLGKDAQKLQIFLELDHIESIKMIMKNPDTLSCLSPFSFQRELAWGDLHPVQITGQRFTRRYYVVTHKKKYLSTLLKRFIASVEEYLGTIGPWVQRGSSSS